MQGSEGRPIARVASHVPLELAHASRGFGNVVYVTTCVLRGCIRSSFDA